MTYLNTDIFISTTELKNNTKTVIEKANDFGEIFIMNNNKPKVVMMSIDQYNDINNFRIVGDVIPMSEYDEKNILESRERYKKGDFITEKELFDELLN